MRSLERRVEKVESEVVGFMYYRHRMAFDLLVHALRMAASRLDWETFKAICERCAETAKRLALGDGDLSGLGASKRGPSRHQQHLASCLRDCGRGWTSVLREITGDEDRAEFLARSVEEVVLQVVRDTDRYCIPMKRKPGWTFRKKKPPASPNSNGPKCTVPGASAIREYIPPRRPPAESELEKYTAKSPEAEKCGSTDPAPAVPDPPAPPESGDAGAAPGSAAVPQDCREGRPQPGRAVTQPTLRETGHLLRGRV